MKKLIMEKFEKVFGDNKNAETFFAPGRVNLIGEHIDYNGGHVLPCALTIGTYAVARVRNDRKLRFFSMNFENIGIIESSIDDLRPSKEADWTNYPKGVIWGFIQKGYKIDNGFDILFNGNIPNGSGLSSSASVEIVTGYILSELLELKVSNKDLALIGQFSENNFNGVNCGIMDQFAIAMGKKDNAIFLDTSSLSFEYTPVKFLDEKIIISCSNKKRSLGGSKYNERRLECEEALREIQIGMGINTLCDLNEELFENIKMAIRDEDRRKRARHVVYENARVISGVKALEDNNIEFFGKLMNESHISLRDDYEVTGIELDTLVEEALKIEGVIGSRMTGAGFGGCTVSIVKNAFVDDFIKNVGNAYKEKIGYEASFYVVDVGSGPCRL